MRTILVTLAFVLVSLRSAAEPADLCAFAESLRAELGVPGIAVAATGSDGLIALGVAGVRSAGGEDPVLASDRFHVGSLTKSMTATVAARLVERGVIGWDTTIEQADATLAAQVPERSRAVTLAQLLAHRAGMPDDRFAAAMQMKFWTLEGPMPDQRREAARLILSQAENAAPGERMTYSNGGYIVAGWMLEAVTGEAWETLVGRELFEPAGMEFAGQGPPGMDPEHGPQPLGHGRGKDGYTPVSATITADNPPVLGPAGRVHCSVADLAAYARLHLRGLRGVGGDYLPRAAFVRLHDDPEGDGYALGWGVQGEDDDRRSMHSGSNTRWLALILVWPSRDLGIVVAMNAVPRPEPAVDVLGRAIEAVEAADRP